MSEKTKAQLLAELKATKIELEEAKRGNKGLWQENEGLTQLKRDQAQEIKDLHEGIERVQKECEGHKTMVTMLKAEKLNEEYEKRRAIADANLWGTRYCKKTMWDCIEDWWHSL